jgi:hypothetical protein
MKSTLKMFNKRIMIFVFLITFVSCGSVIAQKLRFGVFADPVISWFSSDTHNTESKGARTGFNFGLTYNKYFTDNYAFSTGINILNAGGQIVNSVPIEMEFKNMQASVLAGEAVIYKIQYLSVPVGLKFNTNQIGYVSFFTDLGLDPKVVIGGKADIPSLEIEGENAMEELNLFNLSYHITGGIEYSIGGTTALVFGIGFDNNFLDITKDNGSQPVDKISHKIIKFHLGVNF